MNSLLIELLSDRAKRDCDINLNKTWNRTVRVDILSELLSEKKERRVVVYCVLFFRRY